MGSKRSSSEIHAKVVYHEDGSSTHCIHMAEENDDEIENEEVVWYHSPLVGWDGWAEHPDA